MNFACFFVARAGCLASIGEISDLVNVESVEVWSRAGNFSANSCLATVLLGEHKESLDTRVSIWVHDGNSVVASLVLQGPEIFVDYHCASKSLQFKPKIMPSKLSRETRGCPL